LADRKKEVFEDDLRILLMSIRDETFETYSLVDISTTGKDPAVAMIKLRKGEEEFMDTAVGDGPVDASCRAIDRIVGIPGRLEEFNVRAVSPGKEAMGEAHVIVDFENRPFTGNGASTDITEAAILAYLNAVNKFLAIREA
jgi:2-isopropylmalate synthase